jgi:CRP/FNR family transcriptional regulator
MLDECDEFKKYLIKYWANQFYSQALNRTQYPNNITKVKVISYLSDLIEKDNNKNKDIELKLRRKDIAEYIGCSMRTVYRILNQLEESGLINREGHSIIINPQQRKNILKENEINK